MNDRALPHNGDAEQALLGAMMLDPHVIDAAAAIAKPADYYRPAHEFIADAIVSLHRTGRSVDPVVVGEELTKRGLLARVGGFPYLAELVSPTVSFGGSPTSHAAIIREHAAARRLIDQASRNLQDAWESSDPIEAKVARAEKRLREVPVGDPEHVTSVMSLDEFVDQPIPEHDWVIPGLMARGERLVLTGGEGLGKALALETPLPTPTGWTTMGDVKVGDEVLGGDGLPVRVSFATDVMVDHDCFEVEFSDGSKIVADADHLWLTDTLKARECEAAARRRGPLKPRGTDQTSKRRHFPSVVTTRQIGETLMARGGHAVNHSIRTCEPLDLPDAKLSVDPYVLGAWLGDGTSLHAEITCHVDDREIIDRIALTDPVREKAGTPHQWVINTGAPGPRALTLSNRLRKLGVHGNKHIPQHYLRASFDQRLALLQGLMDTDGTVVMTGGTPICEFSVTSRRLAEDVHELLSTFGIKCQMREGSAKLNGRIVGTRYRLSFQTDLPVFHLARKANRLQPLRTQRAKHRYIVAVRPVTSVPVRCIQVENADHLYLAGKMMIPTHNTVLMRQFAMCAAAGIHPFTYKAIPVQTALYVDAENPTRIMVGSFGGMRDAIRRNRGSMDEKRMWIERRPAGMNLGDPADVLWLQRLVSLVNPDLLCIGPAYKLFRGSAKDREEDLARQVTTVLDSVRASVNCALILEHHAGHATSGAQGQRDMRPRGSSLWLAWPEFGFGIRAAEGSTKRNRLVDCVPWRGDREERDWPEQLGAGEEFMPWMDARFTY